ncbi:hypothetical protein [Planobispora rosea]|uniref:hypothetical protein n=1 Tax=Planobispora rosea TaxID=35762 RepID=UPI00114D2C6B|nr:hypothetical protein [Planobispora rosea]
MAELTFNHALIRSQIAAHGISETEFTKLTGISFDCIEAALHPNLVGVGFVWKLAEILGLPPGDLIIRADDTPAAPTTLGNEKYSDIDLLQAALIEHEPFSPSELTDIFGWTPQRLDNALDNLAGRLSGTPLQLFRTEGVIELVRHNRIIENYSRHRLILRRMSRVALSPREAQYLVDNIRSEITRPLNGKDGRQPSILLPIFCQDMADRHLLIVKHLREPDSSSDVTVQVHPDVLFALRLPSALSTLGQESSPEQEI